MKSLLVVLTLAVSGSISLADPDLQSSGMYGAAVYAQGKWGAVRSLVENPDNQPVAPLVAVTVSNRENVQFCKEVWLPPRSKRTVVTPLLPLKVSNADDKQGLDVQYQLIMRGGGREESSPRQVGLLPLPRDKRTFVSVVAAPPQDEAVVKLHSRMREVAELGPTMATMRPREMPMHQVGWDVVGGFVAGVNEPDLTSAQYDALRRWILGGGRIWIMLDKTGEAFGQRLLGSAWDVAVFGRVGLTDFTIKSLGRDDRNEPDRSVAVSVDYPVDLLRVHSPTMRVTHEVGGYPAAMRLQLGDGEVLITTLHASGWLEADRLAENKRLSPLNSMRWFMGRESGLMGADATSPAEPLRAFNDQQIGFEILGATPVMGVLLVLVVGLLVIGFYLNRRGRLEWIGAIGAGAAVAAAVVLIALGITQQRTVSTMVASATMVRPASELPYARAEGLAGVYRTSSIEAGEKATIRGRELLPVLHESIHGSDLKRLVWTDINAWEWANRSLPPGAIHPVQLRGVQPTKVLAGALVTLSEDRLVAQISGGPFSAFEDVVIASRYGMLAGVVQPDGSVEADPAKPLDRDQFVAGTILTDKQRARQQVARDLFLLEPARLPRGPEVPSVLGWAVAQPTVELSEEAVHRDAALVALPITVARPALGERVTIPSVLLPWSIYRPAAMRSGSTVYSEQMGWIDNLNTPQTVYLAFEVPEALRGVDIESAKFSVFIDAPQRDVRLTTRRAGRDVELMTVHSPSGEIEVDLPGGSEGLRITADGLIVLGVDIGNNTGDSYGSPWGMRTPALSVTGTASQPRSK